MKRDTILLSPAERDWGWGSEDVYVPRKLKPRYQVTPKRKEQALAILKRMDEIPRNEMMRPGDYVFPTIANPKLAERGAICQGHQACAIGSLMLAAGQEIQHGEYDYTRIFGAAHEERQELFKRRRDVQLAYDALELASAKYIEAAREGRPGYEKVKPGYVDPRDKISILESLFEADWPPTRGDAPERSKLNAEMRKVIKEARRIIREL